MSDIVKNLLKSATNEKLEAENNRAIIGDTMNRIADQILALVSNEVAMCGYSPAVASGVIEGILASCVIISKFVIDKNAENAHEEMKRDLVRSLTEYINDPEFSLSREQMPENVKLGAQLIQNAFGRGME